MIYENLNMGGVGRNNKKNKKTTKMKQNTVGGIWNDLYTNVSQNKYEK